MTAKRAVVVESGVSWERVKVVSSPTERYTREVGTCLVLHNGWAIKQPFLLTAHTGQSDKTTTMHFGGIVIDIAIHLYIFIDCYIL